VIGSSRLGRFFLDRLIRSLVAVFGLAVFGFGIYLQIQANLGLDPWNALNQGLAQRFSVSFGVISVSVSFLVIVLDLLLHESIGLGTLLDAVTVGICVDIFAALNIMPVQTQLPVQLVTLLVGILFACVGQFLYMKVGLSCGPRDGFLVAVGKRLPKVPIGVVSLGIFAVVFGISLLVGSPIGIGTVVATFGTGPIMEVVFRVLRFEPRNVEHEGLAGTWRAFCQAIKRETQQHTA